MTRSRIDDMIKRQEGLTEVSRQTLDRLQLEKLNRLLAREKERGGFYAGLPERLESLAELAALPFTTDEDLAREGGRMLLVSQGEVQRVLSDATSGTTGSAKRVFYTEFDCEHTVELFMAGIGEFVFPGGATMICMPFSGPFGLGELIAEAVSRLGARPVRVGVGRSYGELRRILSDERPDTYIGMPAELLGMLRVCGRGSLERALISGDACPASVIAGCEKILGTKLFPHYGSREMGLGGAICCPAHEGMHLRENHVIAEIVDEAGRVLPKGEPGELVITTIGMEAQPLIRYRTGDLTRILPDPCPCGSETIRLDYLHRAGEAGEMSALDDALFALDFVADYRAIRTDAGLTLEILSAGSADESALRRAIPELCKLAIRPAKDDDRPLYLGKRRIEHA